MGKPWSRSAGGSCPGGEPAALARSRRSAARGAGSDHKPAGGCIAGLGDATAFNAGTARRYNASSGGVKGSYGQACRSSPFKFESIGGSAFISYSQQDKAVADAVCHRMEAASIRCWIAPRDVAHGETWDDA